MMNFKRRVPGGPTFLILAMAALLALGLAGCSDDTLTGGPEPMGETATGVFHVDLGDSPVEFEIISAKNGDPEDPILGPMAIRGRNIRYEEGALVMDLSVKNIGDETYDEPVKMTFLTLLPEGVTVLNPDNTENGAGAMIEFQFEDGDAQWAPGEESLGRETRFGVDEGVAIGFVARLDAGDVDGDLGSLGGMVWNDENGDGVMDETEAGVPGATLELSAEGMEAVTTLSGEDGTYAFDDLEAGFYSVRRLPMEGYVGTTANLIYVILVMDDGSVVSFMAANFGVRMDEGGDPMGVISGLVWNDENGDGVRDEGEAGVEGIPVVLSGDVSDTTTTDADGMYAFEMLAAGSYELVSLGPDGWSLTTESPVQVVLPENDSVFDAADFGWKQDEVEPTGSISGLVWNDENGDGVKDESEAGVEGIPVVLAVLTPVKAFPDTVMTDADGMYMFEGLGAGDYGVESLGPEGWSLTTASPVAVTLEADDSVVENVDFGWKQDEVGGSGFISGVVFNDLNGDGVRDEGEAGVEGITVELTGAATGSTVTSSEGVYSFLELGMGDYTVTSLGPEGWTYTTGPLDVKLDETTPAVTDADHGWVEGTTP